MRKGSLGRFVLEQAIIGRALGGLLAAVLLDLNARHIYIMVMGADSPVATLLTFILTLTLLFAVGASLTGMLIKMSDEKAP